MALVDDLQAWKLNEDFKASFNEALENTTNAATAFAIGVVMGDNVKAKEYVLDLDKDPDDKGRNLVAYRLGIKVGPLVLGWIMDVVFKNLPVGAALES